MSICLTMATLFLLLTFTIYITKDILMNSNMLLLLLVLYIYIYIYIYINVSICIGHSHLIRRSKILLFDYLGCDYIIFDLDLLKTLILLSAFHLFLKKKLHVCRFHFV